MCADGSFDLHTACDRNTGFYKFQLEPFGIIGAVRVNRVDRKGWIWGKLCDTADQERECFIAAETFRDSADRAIFQERNDRLDIGHFPDQ